jgi:TRAP-type C4-dicarboxylate transport system permease small subunit
MQKKTERLEQFETSLVLSLEYIAGVLLVALFIVVLLAFLDRFVLAYGWGWTEETARFLLVWTAFVAFALCVNKGLHYKVTFFADRFLDNKSKIILDIIIFFICFFIILLIGIKGVYFTFSSINQLSPALRISMSYIYSGIPICSLLIIFFTVINILHKLKELKKSAK